ncbi:MAG: transporting ATPase, KdpC subunit [Planctomycetaceae bacterium]|nr:transporting ATPase, KdpC subunit [Planctomycetaceae bacterium]
MIRHLTANLWLLVLTIVICAIVYPMAMLGIGQAVFPSKANGSLITDKKTGKLIGSSLIAQPFASDEYFQPRPSAVSYNAAATGGSNWGANNPNLRKRVVGALGPMLKYRDGRPVGPDIVVWVQDNLKQDQTILSQWVESDPYLAERWGSANGDFLAGWGKEHADDVAGWSKDNSDAEITPTGLASLFFASYAKGTTATWPETNGTDLQVAFFEHWWRAHPKADVQPIPADLVMTSGCGLDPHITLKGALYQLDRVAGKWAATAKQDPAQTKKDIEILLRSKATAPLGGLVGVELINVLEVNLALKDLYGA